MPSLDIVSEINMHEVLNAVQNTEKDIASRYDFRGCDVRIELNDKAKTIKITGENQLHLDGVLTMLHKNCSKRGIDLQALDEQDPTASGKLVYQVINLQDELDKDTAKKINKAIKDSGLKVQSSIQGDKIRVTDKKRDKLQEVMALIKSQSFGVPLQFTNFKD